MSAYKEFTGKTVEEALRLAREEFGAEFQDLDFEVLSPGSRGVLGMGAEPARIVAAPRAALGGAAPKRDAAASTPLPPQPPRDDRPPRQDSRPPRDAYPPRDARPPRPEADAPQADCPAGRCPAGREPAGRCPPDRRPPAATPAPGLASAAPGLAPASAGRSRPAS